MQFRVTQNLSSQTARQQVSQAYSRLYDSQLRVSRGKKIATPSDDPANISRLLFFRERLGELNQYEQNTAESRAFVDSAASTLQEASDIIQKARESVIQGLNGTLSQTDRDTVAIAIDGYLQDLVSLANSKVGNRFIFGGTRTDAQPFEISTDGSAQTRVRYAGNNERIRVEIGSGVLADINIPGMELFSQKTRGATLISGITGARAGSGTDSGVGLDKLIVTQTGTTLGGASGLALGTSSAGGDTIIGVHSIQVDDVAKTISLNGGPPVSYTGSETDLQVQGPGGEVIHLDTTGIAAGYTGAETATGTGTLSIDGGATTQPITFASNQQVVDSYSGEILNVDTTGIRQAGVDDVSFSGTYDLFQALVAIRDGLKELDQKPDKVKALDFLRDQLNELDGAHEAILQGLGELGSISQRLEASESRIQDLDVRLQELISKTEDVDISDAVIKLQQDETAYQSALLVTSRINNISLLNYL